MLYVWFHATVKELSKMRMRLNLSIIASLVVASIGIQSVAYAEQTKGVELAGAERSSSQVYVNSQQRSLYQIALLSGISVAELRQLNKGVLDKTDIVKVGERIILPSTSPLLSTANAGGALPVLSGQNKIENVGDSVDYKVASALQALGSRDWNNVTSDQLANEAKSKLESETQGYIRNQVNSYVVDPIQNAAQNLLSKFGTAEVKLSVSDEFRLRGSSAKLFSPWYDSTNTLIFSQMSIAEYDSRWIGNVGLGQRWDVSPDVLLGYNVFYDYDLRRKHSRLGAGVEFWTDYVRLAGNYYWPLSDWRESKDFEDFEERAARGFDIRAQAYLPSYPHLGGSLMFEKYYGDQVALFGKDNLQTAPYAVTVGVDYTPVPMFTIKASHKQGRENNSEAKMDFQMNYRIGVPLQDQLDPNKVAAARSLKGSRYDLVDRNNNIVLEYRDMRITVDLAAIAPSAEGSVVALNPVVKTKSQISSVEWIGDAEKLSVTHPALTTRGASVNNAKVSDVHNWSIIIPKYVNADGTLNQTEYELGLVVYDTKGKSGKSNMVKVNVLRSLDRKPVINKAGINNGVISISANLGYQNSSFNDNELYNSYPTDFGSITNEQLNAIWKVRDENGNLYTLVKDMADCSEAQTCLVVTGISKDNSGDKQQYNISFERPTSGAANYLDIQVVLGDYPASDPYNFDLSGSGVKAKLLKIYEASSSQEPIVITTDSEWESPEGMLTVGNTLIVKAYSDVDGTNEINDPDVSWSLESTNALACDSDTTTLTNFIVGKGSAYTLKGVDASLASKEQSINGIIPSPAACAGDQGFKIKVSVY